MKVIDWRALALIALCLTEVGAWAQSFVGQANDASDTLGNATDIGNITLPGDFSTTTVTRTIGADFYGDADNDDWYTLNVAEEPTWPSCFAYGHARLFVTLPLPPGASAVARVLVYGNPGNPELVSPGDSGNPLLYIADFGGQSCGSITRTFILVHRLPGAATPLAYTLGLSLERVVNVFPQITAISRTHGPIGTVVTVSGTDLVPQIKFGGGVDATVTQSSVTSITTSVPAGAKSGPITVFTTPSQQVFTVIAPAGVGPSGSRADTLPAAPLAAKDTSVCCTVALNPALVGRLGHLVVAFPAGAVPTGTPIAIVKEGKQLQSGYGSQTWDLLPGTYDVKVAGKVVSNVSVQARSDTSVRVGVLRVSASSQTPWEVVDGGAAIASGYGTQLVGLPAGSYGLRVSGQTESFTIGEGQVTDF